MYYKKIKTLQFICEDYTSRFEGRAYRNIFAHVEFEDGIKQIFDCRIMPIWRFAKVGQYVMFFENTEEYIPVLSKLRHRRYLSMEDDEVKRCFTLKQNISHVSEIIHAVEKTKKLHEKDYHEQNVMYILLDGRFAMHVDLAKSPYMRKLNVGEKILVP